MIEVELKYKLPPTARLLLQRKLAGLPSSKRLGQIKNVDIYYDTTDFACLRQAVFIRKRNGTCLEIKYHEQEDLAHKHCSEQCFPLTANPLQVKALNELCTRFLPQWRVAKTVEEALTLNNLVAFAHLKNQRIRYAYGRLTLCVDHVEGFGDFFEVETRCQEESQVSHAQTQVQDFVNSLALPKLFPVKVGYVELWLRMHLPQVYRLGMYRLEDELEQSYIRKSGVRRRKRV